MPQSSGQNMANTSNSIFQMSTNKWVGWGAKREGKTRGWFAEGMSWGISGGRVIGGGRGGGKLGRNSEEGQLNIHYQAAGEKSRALLLLCVGLLLTLTPRHTSTSTHTLGLRHTPKGWGQGMSCSHSTEQCFFTVVDETKQCHLWFIPIKLHQQHSSSFTSRQIHHT